MEETVTFHSCSSALADTTTKQHFEVQQPESPQSLRALSCNLPRGSWTLSVKTQWEALYRPDVGQDACAAEPPPPAAEGWRHTHASLQGYVGTFNKAERKLNNYYWLRIKLPFMKHLGAEY